MLRPTAACVLVCATTLAASSPAAAADAQPAARGVTEVRGAPHDEAAALRAALGRYFQLVDDGQVDAAVAACHSTNPAEAALAVAMARLGHGQEALARAVQYRFGDDAVRQTVTRPNKQRAVARCRVAVDGDTAVLHLTRKVQYGMVRVGTEWKLSMRYLAEDFGRPASELGPKFSGLAETFVVVADRVARGNYKDVRAVQAALAARGYRSGGGETADAR